MSAAGEDGWQQDWAAMIARVGQDIRGSAITWGADRIEVGSIRRFVEPLEFDEPLHRDIAVARANGYAEVVAPFASVLTFSLPAIWEPGEIAFGSAERNAQPNRGVGGPMPGVTEKYRAFFATDMEFDFLRPALVGERIGRRGSKLLSCEPKQTSVGRGAFIKFEAELIVESGEVIARQRVGLYVYAPGGSGQ